jgi:flagellar motor protein MotB
MLKEEGDRLNFWPAYVDLALAMVMVLILFLMTFTIASTMVIARVDFRTQELEARKARIRQALMESGYASRIREIRDQPQRQLLVLDASVLFPPDRAHRNDMTREGRDLCSAIGAELAKHAEFIDRIEVEGHTDSNPSSRFYRPDLGDDSDDHGNWLLSAARAKAIVEMFQANGIQGKKLAVIGRSKYVPVSASNKRENRRIEIAIWYSVPDQSRRVP